MTTNARDEAIDQLWQGAYNSIERESPTQRNFEFPRPARTDQLEQLFIQQSALGDQLAKPYLSYVPSVYAAEILVFDWLTYLVEQVGYKGAVDAIRYYRTVDWITDSVETELLDYLFGLSFDSPTTGRLTEDDHRQSLVYLARINALGTR